jgi:hypothetical protein
MEFLLIGLFRIESELRSHCNIFGPIRRTETGHAFDEEDAHRGRALFSSALGSNVEVTFDMLPILLASLFLNLEISHVDPITSCFGEMFGAPELQSSPSSLLVSYLEHARISWMELRARSFPLIVAFLYLAWCTNNEKILPMSSQYVGESKLKHMDYYGQL